MAQVLVVEVDEVLRPPRVRVEARAVRIAVRLPDAVDEQEAAVVLRDGVAEAASVRAIGAAVEQRPAERLEAPVRRVDRPGVIRGGRERRLGDPAEQERVVAEDHVVALVAVGHVVARAAHEHVAAEIAEQDVVGAVLEGARVDQPDRRDRGRLDLLQALVGLIRVRGLLHDDAVVAEDHVVEQHLQRAEGRQHGAELLAEAVLQRQARRRGRGRRRRHRLGALAVDQVAPRVHRVGVQRRDRLDRLVARGVPLVERRGGARVDGGDGQRAREDVHVEAGVAVDVIDAAEAEDRVVAGAAREMVACLATDDQVVACAAVGREADGRQHARAAAVDPAEEPASVDDVVAGVVERVGEREDPFVVLVLLIRDPVERIEGLRAELVTLHVPRLAAVPDAVLRRVAVDDER